MEIPLRNRFGEVVAVSVIDDEEAALAAVAWYRSAQGYAVRTVGRGRAKRAELLHRVIMGAPRGAEVDHLNHDTLDNRRANLRLTDKSGNMQNRAPRPGRDLPRNVYRVSDASTYRVIVNRTNVGNFRTVEEADAVAKAWRAEHMPMSAEAAEMAGAR